MVFDDAQVEQFVRDGAIRLAGAFPRELADECRSLLWAATGCDEHDPSTWSRPGRWVPRTGLGTFPIRFPSADDPGDAGWHVEASGYGADGRPRVELVSSQRMLLMLFLFSEVGPADAPTRVRLGSHRAAAALLAAVRR